jgi:hypothetical protein
MRLSPFRAKIMTSFEMNKHLLIHLCGVHSLGFAVFHCFFWRIFQWRQELPKLRAANRGILQILNLRLIYVFLFAAILCFLFPEELRTTRLGNAFLIGASVFWWGRAIEQFLFFRINHPLVHFLSFLFVTGGVLFLLPLF